MLLRKLTCPAGVLQIDRGLYKNIKSEKFMKFEIYTPSPRSAGCPYYNLTTFTVTRLAAM
jgi:hypothetical protein